MVVTVPRVNISLRACFSISVSFLSSPVAIMVVGVVAAVVAIVTQVVRSNHMAMAMIVAVPRVSISLGGWLSISFPFLSSPVAIMMVRVVAAVVAIVTQAMSIAIGEAMDACVAMVAMAIVIPG